jgi:hypothetical protein
MSDETKKDEQAPEVKAELSGESLPESELELEELDLVQAKLPLIRSASRGKFT